MINIYLKEIGQYFYSLIAYIVISVFLISMGLILWVFPETSVLDYGYAEMDSFFNLSPYILMFLIPAITMRSFSEEYKTGTIELLYTRPYTDWSIIMGKYLSSLTVIILAIVPTITYYISLYNLSQPIGNIDTSGIIGSYIGLVLLSAVFCAIGIMCSSFTENQIIAFIVGVFVSFIVYSGFRSIAGIDVWLSSSSVLDQLGIVFHYESLSKGVIDTRNVIYFCVSSFLFLLYTWFILSRRKW